MQYCLLQDDETDKPIPIPVLTNKRTAIIRSGDVVCECKSRISVLLVGQTFHGQASIVVCLDIFTDKLLIVAARSFDSRECRWHQTQADYTEISFAKLSRTLNILRKALAVRASNTTSSA